MKLFSGLFGLIILFLAVAFALANRETASISLWPFDAKMDAPLYLLTLGTFFAGLLVGALFAWFSMLPHHFESRRMRKDMSALHTKLEDLHRTIQTTPRSEDLLPPPPKRRFWSRNA